MGRRGPQPTPTPLLRLRGSWRAETRAGEPQAAPELPDAPAWLRADAAEHWNEVGRMLNGLGLMAKPHTLALAMLVECLADYIETRDIKVREQLLKLCREFGMTPAAITSVRSVTKDEKPAGLARMRLAK